MAKVNRDITDILEEQENRASKEEINVRQQMVSQGINSKIPPSQIRQQPNSNYNR